MVLSLSELVGETARGRTPVRVTLFGSYACTTTRSMWPLVAAMGDSLGETIDLRFGHVLGASGTPAAHRAAEAAEAACGQRGFGRMHAWLMAHPERHAGEDASEWADAAGLDVPRFRADLWEGAAAAVQAHQVAARAIGADQGPSLWLGGARYTGVLAFTSLLRAVHVADKAAEECDLQDGGMDQKDAWLALAAHELRAPLSSLRALTSLMATAKEVGAAPNDQHLVVVRRVVQRMHRLIGQMTTTAAMRGDYTQPPPSEKVELGSLAGQVVEALVYEQLPRAKILVHSPVPVYGVWPTGWVEQVVSNLVGNAVKFGGEGQVDVDVTGDAMLATLIVRDKGPGLAVDDWPRLVRAYERGSNRSGTPGLGLGLHVVHTLVGAMGGRVSLDRSSGHGSVLRAEWPRTIAACVVRDGGEATDRLSCASRDPLGHAD
jgi:signal transduction histidine kinase